MIVTIPQCQHGLCSLSFDRRLNVIYLRLSVDKGYGQYIWAVGTPTEFNLADNVKSGNPGLQ